MSTVDEYIARLKLPDPYSHKGQNGKLLIIGGSELFHAASKWSLDIASKFVDMVFYSSIASNNELIQQTKSEFWNGIVIERSQISSYIAEADVILIGPGMERAELRWPQFTPEERDRMYSEEPTEEEWSKNTEKIVNYLIHTYPQKKWVIDAGALQMVVPQMLGDRMIITPHQGELDRILSLLEQDRQISDKGSSSALQSILEKGATVLLKGRTDFIYHHQDVIEVTGGNAGMTKGGTGDVLAGIVAALYCTNPADVAAVVASFANKQAGENLAQSVGPFFNASDLVEAVPPALWTKIESLQTNKPLL